MRIRKHAAKLLLGSACPPHHSPPRPSTPPPPANDRSAAAADGLFLCQLNSSPWDVTDFNSFFFHQEGGGREEGMEGIMGNAFGLGDEEGILGISEASGVAVVGEPFLDCEDDEDDSDPKKKVKKRRRRKKKENEEKTSSVVTVIAKSGGGGAGVGCRVTGICKKNDGKGWHCNRPANPYHTLCDHHLTQLKSYSSARYNSSSNSAAREEEAGVVRHDDSVSDLTRVVEKDAGVPRVKTSRRPKTKAAVSAGSKSAGDGYYYYSGFGLQRGKNRSNGGKDGLAGKKELESGDGSDAPIAGDDLDDDDDDTDTDFEEDVKIVGNVDNNNSKGRMRRKKRGRKPIKARSLKSLL